MDDFKQIMDGQVSYKLKKILDPEPLETTRGRPPLSRAASGSTKREISQFEASEEQFKAR